VQGKPHIKGRHLKSDKAFKINRPRSYSHKCKSFAIFAKFRGWHSRVCWLWSLILFLIHRYLFSAVLIPHEDYTPLHAGGF
jgi:hypothetical protein